MTAVSSCFSTFWLGPVPSSQKALKLAGLTLEQMDRVEVNEAFAAQYLVVEKVLGLNRDKTNVNGGAFWSTDYSAELARRLDEAEYGRVPTLRHLNPQSAAAPGARIIFAEPRPQPCGFGAHDRVLPRVEVGPSVEHLEANHRLLDLIVPSLEVPLHDEPKKAREPLVVRKAGTGQHTGKFRADREGIDRNHWEG
jgi:hypothetical protein